MAFLDLFSDGAEQYASARPRYPEELFAFIADTSPARNMAWDCGTGNGQAAVSLASHFTSVFASDPSSEQIAHAYTARNVQYAVEPAERTSIPDGSADAICVAQALHWFEFDAFFGEVRRVAVPGALFVAWGYSWFNVSKTFDAEFQELVLGPIKPYWAPQNRLVWRGYTDVPFPFHRIHTPSFHVTTLWNLQQLLTYVGTWSAVRRCVAENGSPFLDAAADRLAPHWGDVNSVRTVTMPMSMLAGRVK